MAAYHQVDGLTSPSQGSPPNNIFIDWAFLEDHLYDQHIDTQTMLY